MVSRGSARSSSRPARSSSTSRSRRSISARASQSWGNTIVQLTWQSEIGFVYDKATFKRIKSFNYVGEGWGLTHDGTRLIMSDGTATLRFLDPATFKETGRLNVRDNGVAISKLNELEFVKGEILANVWQTSRVARISPKTGDVIGWIDLSGLLDAREAARDRRPERDCLRREGRSAVRDREVVAEALRDKDRSAFARPSITRGWLRRDKSANAYPP